MSTPPLPGEAAPDFSLPDTHGTPVRLSDLRGGPVALVFYPFAFSSVCTGELCQLRDELAAFVDAGVQVLAISTDTSQSLKAWGTEQGFQFPLLSDFWPHGEVAKAYDVFFDKAGMALRGTFLVDVDGVIRFAEVNGPGQARDQVAWQRAVTALVLSRS